VPDLREIMFDELNRKIHQSMDAIGRPVRLMEVCGTHTVSIFRHGIRSHLPKSVRLLSGPGCPVCVTSVGDIEAAISLARTDGIVLTTFGDMMRVPGKKESLSEVRAEGADIRILYSPLDALQIARENPDKKVVFFATGFETTSPSVAGTLYEAERRKLPNFYLYSVHKLVPPALRALLASPDVKVDGFILPGHVSAVIGMAPYAFLATEHGKPSVITGFEAADVVAGVFMLVEQTRKKAARVENAYTRVVKPEGNPKAMEIIDRYFEPEDAFWRGIGMLPGSGLRLRDAYAHRNAIRVFGIEREQVESPSACQCGAVLQGIRIPTECKLFGKGCTPEHPVGPCMVSTEGSCAAYYKYGDG